MLTKAEGGKIKDVSILDVTPENFICPKGEENFYHCRIEVKKFNAETGERLSKPRMQIFGRKFFETFGLHHLRKQGYTVEIMHDPAKWEAEHKEEAERIAKEKEELAARREEERKKAEREAMKAEILAELKEAGVIPGAKRGRPAKETKEENNEQ